MFRIFALPALVLLSLAATQCIAVEKKRYVCEEKLCDAECRRRYAMSQVSAFGKCDGVICNCYKRLPCNDSVCEKVCRERLGQVSGLHSNCTGGQCSCTWDKACVESECAKTCQQSYPDADSREALCNGTLCICKWQGGPDERSSAGEATKAPSSEAELRLRGHQVFTLDEELKPRGEKEQAKEVEGLDVVGDRVFMRDYEYRCP